MVARHGDANISGHGYKGCTAQPPQFPFLQDLREIDKNHKPAIQLAHASHVFHLTVFEDFRRGLNVVGSQAKYLRCRINDQPDHFVFDLGHKDAIFAAGLDFGFAEALAQIDNRDDLSTQIDHAFHILRSVGHGGDVRDANDLMHQADRHAESFLADAEANQL